MNGERHSHTASATPRAIVEHYMAFGHTKYTADQVAEAWENIAGRLIPTRQECCGGVAECVSFDACLRGGNFDDNPKSYVCIVLPHQDRIILDGRYYSVETVRAAIANRSDEHSNVSEGR